MIVDDVRLHVDDRVRASARLVLEADLATFPSTGTKEIDVWFDWPASYHRPTAPSLDPFAIIALPVALATGETLRLSGPISEQLMLNLLEAAEIYRTYFPNTVKAIAIEGRTHKLAPFQSDRIGSFYSGGIDSLFNVAEMRRLHAVHGVGTVTDLWLVQGMDIPLADADRWTSTRETLTPPAEAAGFRVVDIRTNARASQFALVGWTETGFSAVLGAISKLFAEHVPLALIGSYGHYGEIVPHASSPLVDPLWSCDRQSVRHFTPRATRQDKVASILAHAPELLQHVRVCFKNEAGAYNCGVCEKCLRTQCQMLIADDACDLSMFDEPLAPRHLKRIRLPCDRDHSYAWAFWRDIARGLGAGGHRELQGAVETALYRNRIRCLLSPRAPVKRWLQRTRLGRSLLRAYRTSRRP